MMQFPFTFPMSMVTPKGVCFLVAEIGMMADVEAINPDDPHEFEIVGLWADHLPGAVNAYWPIAPDSDGFKLVHDWLTNSVTEMERLAIAWAEHCAETGTPVISEREDNIAEHGTHWGRP